MGSLLFSGILFAAKVLDNALSTAKTILIQRSKWLLAGLTVMLSDFIYFTLTKTIISSDSMAAIITVSAAGGAGCSIACLVSEKLSKDRVYVSVIMSDDLNEMKKLRDFLAANHITNTACDSYTLDWDKKTISITAYPETKAQDKLIGKYISGSGHKFKRVLK